MVRRMRDLFQAQIDELNNNIWHKAFGKRASEPQGTWLPTGKQCWCARTESEISRRRKSPIRGQTSVNTIAV